MDSIRAYVHALGERLESSENADERIELARMLAGTGSHDAQPYLLEAITRESEDHVRRAIQEALSTLSGGSQG